jgi:hypothetical protein
MNKPLDQLSTAELIALLGERDQQNKYSLGTW